MYDYEVRRIKATELEPRLERLSDTNWELVTIIPTGETLNAPLTGEYFLIVARRPRQQ
jgi:hypothetical protein